MQNAKRVTRKAVRFTVLLALAVITAASAMATGITGSLYTAGVTKYLWRGQVLSDGFAVQPGITINAGKFSIGYWGSAHEYSSDFLYNESDYTISFSDTAPYLDFLGLKAGFTAYNFPYGGIGARTSVEVFAGLTSTLPASPYLTYYYDAQLGNGGYLEAGVSHSISIIENELKATGSATCGYNFGQWMDPSFTVAGLTLGLSYTVAGFTVSPSVFYQVPLDQQYEGLFCGSLGLNYDFTL